MKNIFKMVGGVVVTGVVMTIIEGCSTSQGGSTEEAPQVSAQTVETVIAQRSSLTSMLTIPGELISYQHVDLYAREAAFVKDILVDVGSEVNNGQVLATLEAPEIMSRLHGAQSRLKAVEAVYVATRANHERLLATSETPGTVSPNELEQSRAKVEADLAQLESARASVREIQNTLSYLTIRAPFAGVISARNVNPGAYVGSGAGGSREPLFVLQQQKLLRLVVSVPEAFTAYMKKGDEVRFTVKAVPNRTFKATIARMAGALDTKLRSQRVEMDVRNEDRALLPGMIANVKVPMKGDSVFVVPATAVANTPERIFVIRIENDTARWVDISVGRTWEGKIEVFGDIGEGSQLIRKATDEIRNGQHVRIADAAD